MRLHWFAPPPTAADRTLLAAVADRAAVTVWTDRDGFPDDFGSVRRFDWADLPWAEVNRADVAVYHLADDADRYGNIWRVSRRQPGLIVLRDLKLHRLVRGAFQAADDWAGYRALLEARHGRHGWAAAYPRWTGADPACDDFPLTATVVEGALAVVVPTRTAFRRLRSAAVCPVAYAPWPGPGDEPLAAAAWADRLLSVAAAVPRLRAARAARGLSDRVADRWETALGMSLPPAADRRVAAAVGDLFG